MTEKRIAKITKTFLGVEDHGILTVSLTLDYGTSVQGVGGYALDEPVHVDGEFMGRQGTAFGMEWIRRVLLACGVREWDALVGRTVYAVVDGEGFGGKVVGLAPLPTEGGEEFDFEDLSREFFPEGAAA